MRNNFQKERERGFGLTELVVAVAISVMVVIVVTGFARSMIRLSASAQADAMAIFESRNLLRVMVSELRSAIPSAQGSYPIGSVATSSIIFFADVNDNGVADRIRYFYDPADQALKRGVIFATGTPPAYSGSETISILVSGVLNGPSLPIFEYYDGNYAGTSTPLTIPVNATDVRLIKVNVTVSRNPNDPSADVLTVSSQAMLRNLKDNQ